MSPEITSTIRVVQKEIWKHRRLVIFLYVFTSAVFLVAAWTWPRIYTSSSSIEVDQQNILRPLMSGTAVTTGVQDRATIASKVIFSQRVMNQVLESDTWQAIHKNELSTKDMSKLAEYIKRQTMVRNADRNLIEISYSHTDPMVAYETTKLMTEIFIDESLAAKQNESRSAFEFINNQVEVYHEKLKNAEQAIKDFRSKNIDASENAKNNANARLIELKRDLETVEIEISTQESSLETMTKQITGQSGFHNKASIERENVLNERITQLETRLADLKLNYHDTYPDIVQLKGQIKELKDQVADEVILRTRSKNDRIVEAPTGETARTLRTQILNTENTIASLKARSQQLLNLINKERETLDNINAVEAEISELTRDYTVNQNMYQELLSQRENARISMNIDKEKQGLSMKVQDPAFIPVTPKGLRFAHIILAGLAISFMLPVGLVFGLTLLDKKIRTELQVQNIFKIPVLSSVHPPTAPGDQKSAILKMSFMVMTVVAVWTVYGIAIYLRMRG
ncbi:XrtA system polysaccharide chain length determinant [Pleionea sediminis]|uniref:XrtA system polysaccharide chain length determinant n=1 Tax=Pleionea sediminis TaxID=2569479 RepID=UPI001185590B|nr:XrtA system polysaccharide chain length determinant [Pleionea sediminis]